LASGSSERQIAIYKAQVTRRSVSLLSDANVEVRRGAAALIMNMAPHAKIKERIVEAGAIKPLAAAVSDEDDTVRERATGALANLFNDHSANVHTAFQQAPDVIPSLVTVLQTDRLSEEAKRQAAHALAMLAAEDGSCDAVWAAGAGPPLLALLKESVAEAALGIMNLSWRWASVKKELAEGGSLDALAEMVQKGDQMSKEYAVGAIMNMTAGSTENAEKVVSVLPRMIELLKGDGQAAEWAAGAVANVLRVGEDARSVAVNAGAATSLAALLPKVSASGRPLVVVALTTLAESKASTVEAALGAKEKALLREFRDSGDEDLQGYTKGLVDAIGNGFAL
jgi:hypothetical protein